MTSSPVISEPAEPSPLAADELPLRIVTRTSTPLYQQIVHQLKQMIVTQQLEDGAQLPAVRRLSSHLKVNTGTVVQAYRELASQGLAESVRGKGTLVRYLTSDDSNLLAREQLLELAISQMVTRACALGFDTPTIRERLSARLLHKEVLTPVLFVGVTAQQGQRYAEELNTLFAPRGIQFIATGTDEFAESVGSPHHPLETAYTIVTFVTQIPTIERQLKKAGLTAEIIGVTAEIEHRSISQIRSMIPGRQYIVIAEPRAITTVLALLELESGLSHSDFEFVLSDDRGAVDQSVLNTIAAGNAAVVFPFGVRDAVMSMELPPDRLVELRFALTGSTMRQLEARWPTPLPE